MLQFLDCLLSLIWPFACEFNWVKSVWWIAPNGPAIKLVNVTRRPEAGEHYTLLWRKWFEAGEGGYGTCFCCQTENLIEYYECRGTRCDARHMLSPVTEWSRCTGAVSRYKVDARQLLSTVTEVSTGRGGNPGLSPRQLLSNVQRTKQKPWRVY